MIEISSNTRNLVRIQIRADIEAICANCNKRFKSIRSVSMHVKMTGGRHTVNITNYGNYDKKTGLKLMIK